MMKKINDGKPTNEIKYKLKEENNQENIKDNENSVNNIKVMITFYA